MSNAFFLHNSFSFQSFYLGMQHQQLQPYLHKDEKEKGTKKRNLQCGIIAPPFVHWKRCSSPIFSIPPYQSQSQFLLINRNQQTKGISNPSTNHFQSFHQTCIKSRKNIFTKSRINQILHQILNGHIFTQIWWKFKKISSIKNG